MRRKIQVTKRDIKLGVQNVDDSCPVARAVCRTLHKKMGSVNVGSGTISWSSKRAENQTHFEYPKKVGKFIEKFDDIGPSAVSPFTFELRY